MKARRPAVPTVPRLVRNILAWYDDAGPGEIAAGHLWYSVANRECSALAQQFNVPTATVAEVVAVLSPMVRWERNLAEARLVLKRWSRGEQQTQDRHTAFPSNVRKAWAILNREHGAGPRGPKVEAFAALLRDPGSDAVVVDSIAIFAALGVDPNPMVTSDDAKAYFDRPRTLRQIREAYRAAAQQRGVSPSAMQATTWTVWRNERDKA